MNNSRAHSSYNNNVQLIQKSFITAMLCIHNCKVLAMLLPFFYSHVSNIGGPPHSLPTQCISQGPFSACHFEAIQKLNFACRQSGSYTLQAFIPFPCLFYQTDVMIGQQSGIPEFGCLWLLGMVSFASQLGNILPAHPACLVGMTGRIINTD